MAKAWPRHDQGGERTGVWCLESQLRKAYQEKGVASLMAK